MGLQLLLKVYDASSKSVEQSQFEKNEEELHNGTRQNAVLPLFTRHFHFTGGLTSSSCLQEDLCLNSLSSCLTSECCLLQYASSSTLDDNDFKKGYVLTRQKQRENDRAQTTSSRSKTYNTVGYFPVKFQFSSILCLHD